MSRTGRHPTASPDTRLGLRYSGQPGRRRPGPHRRCRRGGQGSGERVRGLRRRARAGSGRPCGHPVPVLGRGEENVGATVVGVVDALHPGVGDEDARHLVVGDVSEQPVDTATPTGGEEVAVRAECRVRIVFHQQALPIPGDGLRWWNLRFGSPEWCDHIHVRTIEQLVEGDVVTLQDDGLLALVLRVPLRSRQAVKTCPDIPVRAPELVPNRRTTGPTLLPQRRQIRLPDSGHPSHSSSRT